MEHKATAQKCLNAAYDKTMSFPEIVGQLIQSGFEGYTVDYRKGTSTYYLPSGESFEFKNPASEAAVAPLFNAPGIIELIKWAQSNSSDYTYTAFSDKAKAFGCAGYIVSFPGRRVLYFGRTAETHTEHFPS